VSCFWIYRQRPSWRLLDRAARRAGVEAAAVAIKEGEDAHVRLRGSYSLIGLRADADFMLWWLTDDLDRLRGIALALRRTPLGEHLEARETYLGLHGESTYSPDHRAAFAKGEPPRRYAAVYPFNKTPEWYLLPFEQRRRLMAEHGEMGREFPVGTNTVRAFGLGDAEFIVALESETLEDLVACVEKLRRAEVRVYTQRDVPIYLGRLHPLETVLAELN
jgi:hydrogen peroxide-dependent heme synthase